MSDSSDLFRIPGHIQTRWASPDNWQGEKGGGCRGEPDPDLAAAFSRGYDRPYRGNDGRKRSPLFYLRPGESRTLAEVQGASGMVRRIWMTIINRSPEMLRGLRIDMYWDGAATPAVSSPLGDFFGHGLGRMATFENALFSSPEGRSFTCFIPMPFRTGMKIVLTNELPPDHAAHQDQSQFILQPGVKDQAYFDVDYTLGDRHDADTAYFHAHWRRECPTTLRRDYEFLPKVTGRGRFLGVNVGVIPDDKTYFKNWWGEGVAKIYLDGDTDHPTLCGTGTEDYIGTGWGQGQYAHAYHGCPVAVEGAYCFYRLHIPDPVWFQQDIRVTMQQIGGMGPENLLPYIQAGRELFWGEQRLDFEAKLKDAAAGVPLGGLSLFERQDDWSSCAYFYLDRPENDLPPLAGLSLRLADATPEKGNDQLFQQENEP
ncbi:MAG: DUF2961 domain-containing protein [Planctomycetes bacterium]|nr:DUF2961 domain-containing protein [Planctomycetota bacterium]